MIFRIFVIICAILSQQQCEAFIFAGEYLETVANVWNTLLNFFDAKISLMERTVTTLIELLQSAILNGTDILSVIMEELQREANQMVSTTQKPMNAMPAAPANNAGPPPAQGVQAGGGPRPPGP